MCLSIWLWLQQPGSGPHLLQRQLCGSPILSVFTSLSLCINPAEVKFLKEPLPKSLQGLKAKNILSKKSSFNERSEWMLLFISNKADVYCVIELYRTGLCDCVVMKCSWLIFNEFDSTEWESCIIPHELFQICIQETVWTSHRYTEEWGKASSENDNKKKMKIGYALFVWLTYFLF